MISVRARAYVFGALIATAASASAGRARAGEVEACLAAAEEGEPLKKQGELVAAKKRLAVCARPVCPAAVRGMCRQYLDDVENQIPTLVVSARDPQGRLLPDLRIFIDNVVTTAAADGTIEVNAGARTVRVEQGGGARERLVEVAPGQKRIPVVVVFEAPVPVAPIGPAPAPDSPREGSHVTSYVLGGLGLAALAGSGVFAIKWVSDAKCSPACSGDETDRIHSDALVTDIFLGVGVVSLAVATVLYFTSTSAAPTHTAR